MKYIKKLLSTVTFFFKQAPLYCCLHIFSTVIVASKVYVIAHFNKALVNTLVQQIQSQDLENVYDLIIIVCIIFILELLYSIFSHTTKYYLKKLSIDYHNKMNISLYNKLSSINIMYFDSATQRNTMTQAAKDMNSIEAVFRSFVSIFVASMSLIASLIIIIRLDVLLTLAIFLSLLPSFFARKKIQINQYELEKELNTTNRKATYFSSLFWDRNVASEMRLYDFSSVFIAKLKELFKIRDQKNLNLMRKNSFLEIICLLISGIINIAYNIYIIILILIKGLTVGDYNYYSSISGNFKGNIDIILNNISTCIVDIKRSNNYFEFMQHDSNNKSGTAHTPEFKKIEFVNVSFTYPDSKICVLKNLSFSVNAGEKIAIAGLNGAGKTTILKLLFRLYEPTSGQILLNGKDIKLYNLEEYQQLFSAMLQDSVTYAISLKENITISQKELVEKNKIIIDLLKSVGITVKESDLFKDIGKDYDHNGIILSKGQFQSLHLARTLYRNSSIYIFDEPASNLDASIEKQIFDKIFDGLPEGKTIILISHRLSNLKNVDRIFFLENGECLETGSHKQLCDLQGKYYALYKIQADRY